MEEMGEQQLLSDRLFWADSGGKHGEVMEVNVRSVGTQTIGQQVLAGWAETVRPPAGSEASPNYCIKFIIMSIDKHLTMHWICLTDLMLHQLGQIMNLVLPT